MATKLKKAGPKRGRKPRLPWDVWFDGSPYRLKRGEEIKAKSLKVMEDIVRKTAKRREISVSVYKERKEDCIVIHAHL